MATQSPVQLADDAGSPPTLRIAPLTVTARPGQTVYGWKYRESWHDDATGWRGVWAVCEGHTAMWAVRVRVMDDWPMIPPMKFYDALWAAVDGHRLPTMADQDRIRQELAAAPVGPAEGMSATVDAQVEWIVGADR